MGVTQFARRLGTRPPTASKLEKSEMEGTITLNSLRRAADALECTLVYALVPKTTLAGAIREQAHKKARAATSSVSHSMALEAQGVDPAEAERQERELIQRLLIELPKSLWDDDGDDSDRDHGW